MTYLDKLNHRISTTNSNLCVGLDVRANSAEEARDLIQQVIAETAPHTAAYKPNAAYFEALGWQGMKLLEELRDLIPTDIPLLLDVKRGDIGETQRYYAKACYDIIRADAVTLNPYMGRDTLEPFLEFTNKGFYLLGITSNPGATDIELQTTSPHQLPIYQIVANMLQNHPQGGLVLGLTNAAPEILPNIPDVPLLIPGLGAQGGDLTPLKSSPRQAPLLINVSRGILYAEPNKTFAQKSQHWSTLIRQAITNS